MHRNLMLTERKKLYNNSAVAEVAAGLVGDGGLYYDDTGAG